MIYELELARRYERCLSREEEELRRYDQVQAWLDARNRLIARKSNRKRIRADKE